MCPPGCTAISTACAVAIGARAADKICWLTPETTNSIAVTGMEAVREARSILPPDAAIAPAIAAIDCGISLLLKITTCSRPFLVAMLDLVVFENRVAMSTSSSDAHPKRSSSSAFS